MTRLVAGLARQRLVTRGPDPKDGRVVWVRPTAKGKRFLRQGRQRRVVELARRLDGVSKKELEAIRRTAELMNSVLRDSD